MPTKRKVITHTYNGKKLLFPIYQLRPGAKIKVGDIFSSSETPHTPDMPNRVTPDSNFVACVVSNTPFNYFRRA